MKSNIIKVAFCTLFAFCALSASADIKSLFQKGEHVTIGDSIKGKMLRFTTDGILHSDSPDAPVLPTECRIVMQDSTFFDPDLVWFENLFPVHTEKDYHKWLKGRYVKNAKFYNEMTHKRDTCDILVIIPFVNIDYMESVKGNDKFTCCLDLRNTIDGRPDVEYSSSDYDTDMECYIKFILKDDMNLYAVNDFGEVETDCATYYNFNVTNPYGINLNKLAHTKCTGVGWTEAYISNLVLSPQLNK